MVRTVYRVCRNFQYTGALAKLTRIAQLAARWQDEISEIEINPVLVHPQGKGVTIVDALVVAKT